jgi:hypothetical protein
MIARINVDNRSAITTIPSLSAAPKAKVQSDAEGGKSATGGLTERDVVVEIEAIDSDQGSAARSSHTSGIGARAWVVDDG